MEELIKNIILKEFDNFETIQILKKNLKNCCNYCCNYSCTCVKSVNHMKKWDYTENRLLINSCISGNLDKTGRSNQSIKCQLGKLVLELNNTEIYNILLKSLK